MSYEVTLSEWLCGHPIDVDGFDILKSEKFYASMLNRF